MFRLHTLSVVQVYAGGQYLDGRTISEVRITPSMAHIYRYCYYTRDVFLKLANCIQTKAHAHPHIPLNTN